MISFGECGLPAKFDTLAIVSIFLPEPSRILQQQLIKAAFLPAGGLRQTKSLETRLEYLGLCKEPSSLHRFNSLNFESKN